MDRIYKLVDSSYQEMLSRLRLLEISARDLIRCENDVVPDATMINENLVSSPSSDLAQEWTYYALANILQSKRRIVI